MVCVFVLPPLFGLAPRWGAAGLTASAGVAGWVEFILLRRTLNARIGHTGLPTKLMFTLWLSALCSALAAWVIKLKLGAGHPIFLALIVLGSYGCLYFALTYLAGIEECRGTVAKVLRRFKR